MQKYYFAFSDHPLVVPYIHVNDPAVSASWISSSLSGLSNKKLTEVANKIVELRQQPTYTAITSFEDMKERLTKVLSTTEISQLNNLRLIFTLWK